MSIFQEMKLKEEEECELRRREHESRQKQDKITLDKEKSKRVQQDLENLVLSEILFDIQTTRSYKK